MCCNAETIEMEHMYYTKYDIQHARLVMKVDLLNITTKFRVMLMINMAYLLHTRVYYPTFTHLTKLHLHNNLYLR